MKAVEMEKQFLHRKKQHTCKQTKVHLGGTSCGGVTTSDERKNEKFIFYSSMHTNHEDPVKHFFNA